MPAGRPTDYSKDTLELAREYLRSYKKLGEEIPTVAGLALSLNISRDTVYEWASNPEHKEFSDILADLKSKQESDLVANGLRGIYNPTIAKLILSSKHDYREKQDIEQKGDITIKWE